MSFLLEFFTWWHRQTLGARFFTWRRGVAVGQDEAGNRYYRDRKDAGRRWVIYAGEVEASEVPPGWRAWLHRTVDEPPSESDYTPRPWEKPHRPNLTGTAEAHRPQGSLRRSRHGGGGERQSAPGERPYHAWNPEETRS